METGCGRRRLGSCATGGPSTQKPAVIKSKLKQLYLEKPFRTIFILGRVAIPYAGQIYPDGHTDHAGAWPADGYFGDPLAEWTDNHVNITTATDPRNRNIPGDGKFDNSGMGVMTVETGRVDMRNLTAFNMTEAALTRRYLLKNHRFRTGIIKVTDRAMHDDQATGLNFGATAWRGYATLCRNTTIPANNFAGICTGNFKTTLRQTDYLWSGSWGPGSYTSVGSNNSAMFVTDSLRTVFTAFFGSYFGDWDSPSNNFLRAALGNKGPILTTCWSGRPFWYFHHMGMGENIGYSARLSMNNGSVYEQGSHGNGVHMGLLGDPTLKLHPMVKPGSVQHAISTHSVLLSWSGSPATDSVAGYAVFKKPEGQDHFLAIGRTPAGSTSFTDTCLLLGLNYYLVRPFRWEKSKGGTYLNYGTGILDTLMLATGAAPNAIPRITIGIAGTLPTCPGLVTCKASVQNTSEFVLYRWFVNGNLTTETADTVVQLSVPERNCQIRCQMVQTGPCVFPTSLWASDLVVSLPMPIAPSVSVLKRSASCKGLVSSFKANVVNHGSTGFQYAWFRNNNLIPGETGPDLNLVMVQNATLKVILTSFSACGLIEQTSGQLAVNLADTVAPVFSTEVTSEDTCAANASVTIRVESNIPFKAGWFKNGILWQTDNFASSGDFVLGPVSNGDQIRLRAISRTICTTKDTLFSPVYTAYVTPSGNPAVWLDSHWVACAGKPVSLTAKTKFAGPASTFEWFKNEQLVDGAVGRSISFDSLNSGDRIRIQLFSDFYCIIDSGTALSPEYPAQVLPVTEPQLSLLPFASGEAICAGKPVTFLANFTDGGPTPRFVWLQNGDSLFSSAQPSFTYPFVNEQDIISVLYQTSAACTHRPMLKDSIRIDSVSPMPEANISLQMQTLFAETEPGLTYTWLQNGLPIPGASDTMYLPTESGLYALVVQNSAGCSDTSVALFVDFTANHAYTPWADFGAQVFPNPVSEKLFFRSSGGKCREIRITDVLGRVQFQQSTWPASGVVVSAWADGIYLVSFRMGDTWERTRLIKQNLQNR